MKIKKSKNNLIINTDSKEVVILAEFDQNLAEKDLVINLTGKDIQKHNSISTPGEYEVSDILVNVFSFGDNLDKPEIIFVDSDENIRILYLAGEVDMVDKSIIDKLPETNILLVNLTKDNVTKKLQIVSDLEPDIFIPLADKSVEDDLAKDLGVKDVEEIGVLNISHKDFTEESSDLLVYFLK